MFLHKQGCKYYQLVFKNLEHETTAAVKNSNNNSGRLTIYQCLNSSELNPLPHLIELLKHVENIETHIVSEENVLNGFVNKLHSITFIDMKKRATDPEFAELASITQNLRYLDQNFKELKKHLVEVTELIKRSKENNSSNVDAEPLISHYHAISVALDHVFSSSSNLAHDLQKFALSIQKEKELILMEEQSTTDFNKNFMSWFS